MHPAAKQFCDSVKTARPRYFEPPRKVLDCGSLDINGSNRYLFPGCDYVGLDVGEGSNVDVVSLMHEYDPGHQFGTIISTEAFEHDLHLQKSMARIVELLEPGGLFLFTCASTGRLEHGTSRAGKESAPLLEWDHYENVTIDMIDHHFTGFRERVYHTIGLDLQFWGIK